MENRFFKVPTLLFTAAITAFLSSCGKDSVGEKPALSISPLVSEIEFSADGKTAKAFGYTVKPEFWVQTNQPEWNPTSSQPWLDVSVSDDKFTLIAAENTLLTARTPAEVEITAGNATSVKIIVTQLGAAPSLKVTPSGNAVAFSADGTTAKWGDDDFTPPVFAVDTNLDEWTAEPDKNWLTVVPDYANNTFTLTAGLNENPYILDAKVTVSAGTLQPAVITVTQESNSVAPSKYTDIVNPYKDINFNTTLNLRAALHVHTKASDGSFTADEMVTAYAQRKYDVVAITDHDHEKGSDYGPMAYGVTSYRTFGTRNILTIQGVEISNYPDTPIKDYGNVGKENDHFNNFFVTNDAKALLRQKGMKVDMGVQITGTDGVMFLNHPWRCEWPDPITFYTDFFSTYSQDRLIGLEVGTRKGGDAGSNSTLTKYDWEIWDACLTAVAPGRNIYGIATDDAHILTINNTNFFGLRWTEILVPENTIPNVKEAMRNGQMFFVHNLAHTTTVTPPVTVYDLPFPSVTNIVVNKENMTITVEAANYTKIEWISCGNTLVTNNKTTLKPDEYNLEKYVRFVLTGANGRLYSQPFLLPETE